MKQILIVNINLIIPYIFGYRSLKFKIRILIEYLAEMSENRIKHEINMKNTVPNYLYYSTTIYSLQYSLLNKNKINNINSV